MTARFDRADLRRSQLSVTDFIIDTPACACFSAMGFGKTAAVTTAIEKLFRLGEISRALIVTTLRVARHTWPDELRDWKHTSNLKFNVITGGPGKRLAAARGAEHIHIINVAGNKFAVFDFLLSAIMHSFVILKTGNLQ